MRSVVEAFVDEEVARFEAGGALKWKKTRPRPSLMTMFPATHFSDDFLDTGRRGGLTASPEVPNVAGSIGIAEHWVHFDSEEDSARTSCQYHTPGRSPHEAYPIKRITNSMKNPRTPRMQSPMIPWYPK